MVPSMRAVALLLVVLPVWARSNPSCRGCDIVDEGLYGPAIVNQSVYGYDPGLKKFFPVIIDKTSNSMGFGPAVHWYRPDNHDSGWDDAHHYYSPQSYAEIQRGQASARLAPTDRQSAIGQAGACALARSARRSGDYATDAIMTGACCHSAAAAVNGAPPDVCG